MVLRVTDIKKKCSQGNFKNKTLVNFRRRLCWAWLRMRILWWYHRKFSDRFAFFKRVVWVFSTCSNISWLFWSFSINSCHSSTFRSGRIFRLKIRWAYLVAKQDLISLESEIDQWQILWCTTNSYPLGNTWVWRPIHSWKHSIEFLSN